MFVDDQHSTAQNSLKKISPLIEDLRYLRSEDFENWHHKEIGFRRLCSRTIIFMKQRVQEEEKKACIVYASNISI